MIDKNGNETQQKMTLPGGGWKENSMQINVTGGECTIGIYAKLPEAVHLPCPLR
ncbi:hypothetical protein SFC43_12615 [Bacteroides sp. CR5/BHMF/2]|nr:hypothetical protein [Bacteroides sp. CR5/BHMF/2]